MTLTVARTVRYRQAGFIHGEVDTCSDCRGVRGLDRRWPHQRSGASPSTASRPTAQRLLRPSVRPRTQPTVASIDAGTPFRSWASRSSCEETGASPCKSAATTNTFIFTTHFGRIAEQWSLREACWKPVPLVLGLPSPSASSTVPLCLRRMQSTGRLVPDAPPCVRPSNQHFNSRSKRQEFRQSAGSSCA
jgi:hypothetical protein